MYYQGNNIHTSHCTKSYLLLYSGYYSVSEDTSDYVGCFVDSDDRLLPHNVFGGPNPSTDNSRCILLCRDAGYMYAGTEVGTWCFCGNNPWRYTAVDVDPIYVQNYDCDRGCSADSTQICGGGWRLSVYTTGVKNETSQSVQGGKKKKRYTEMAVDRKIDDNKTAISSENGMSPLNCAVLCSINEICTDFVYSKITGMCQLYGLKYHDLCEYTLYEDGSSVYMTD